MSIRGLLAHTFRLASPIDFEFNTTVKGVYINLTLQRKLMSEAWRAGKKGIASRWSLGYGSPNSSLFDYFKSLLTFLSG